MVSPIIGKDTVLQTGAVRYSEVGMVSMRGHLEASQLLGPLDPNEGALTPLFQRKIDESMLCEIAAADYGYEADYYYSKLQPILKTGVVEPDVLRAREVLELIRWSEPEDPKWSPGGQGARGHWMRLFACTALVRLAPSYRDLFEGECSTVAQLTSSAIELGRPVARASASMLAWRFLAYPGDTEDAPFLAFAILLLATHLEYRGDRGQWLNELADWVEDQESCARDAISQWSSSKPHWDKWLLGLTLFDQREAVWRCLADRILLHPERPHPHEAREALQRLGELVCGT